MISTKPLGRNTDTHENPLIGDKATFLNTSGETKGKFTLIEIELVAGGGNQLHYHQTFSETFEVLEGILTVRVGKETKVLKEGESYTVPAGMLHCFSNRTEESVRFLVELKPGNTGFEQAIKIAYGLARDGKTNSKTIPKNFYHLAFLATLSDTYPTGIFSLLIPLFKWGARRAKRKGIDKQLIEEYC